MEIPKQINLKCEVDTQSLNQFVEDLQGLHLAINSLECDIVDINTSVKYGAKHQYSKSKSQSAKNNNWTQ